MKTYGGGEWMMEVCLFYCGTGWSAVSFTPRTFGKRPPGTHFLGPRASSVDVDTKNNFDLTEPRHLSP